MKLFRMSTTKIFGTFIDTPSLGDVRILHDYCLSKLILA